MYAYHRIPPLGSIFVGNTVSAAIRSILIARCNIMKVLIAEFFWQHTEVIGTWLEFFSRQGADITIYYPEFENNTHNYIHIWAKLFKFKFDTTGQLNLGEYDLILFNTIAKKMLEKLFTIFPTTRFLVVGHYSAHSIADIFDTIHLQRICELPVNPFFSCRSATASLPLALRSATRADVADLPPSQPAKFILPVCRQLADAVADCRSATADNVSNKKILIIGNSFKSTPPNAFNFLIKILQEEKYTLSAILYGYNDISGYDFTSINVKRDLPAIDLYKEIEECRFILFLPADYHYFNQLSGAIPLSLTFGRPLITIANVLAPYNIQSFYNIDDEVLLQHLESVDRYKEAQAYMQVRLNEIFATNAEILEDSLRSIGLTSN